MPPNIEDNTDDTGAGGFVAGEEAEAATEVAEAIELKAKKEMKVATEEVVTEEAA